ncbi:MLX-interacting protein isoform X3 [Macrobrachium rosenbergii]|uniref:MLX-interacting protein isoform X3 n=1 Tax=Macrobrachium rosenbergii TaxID=79674 RepID=UPI0034D69A53
MRINGPIMMTADSPAGGPSVGMGMGRKEEKEVIHSGHFMVSDFEAEAQDDEENVLLEIPGDDNLGSSPGQGGEVTSHGEPSVITYAKRGSASNLGGIETFSIDSSLTKLFNAMSIAYRHKITSPKWNRFKGLKLRWKDKIRLNNVIWRCWHMQCKYIFANFRHMQFIRKKRMTVCQFALDVDLHNRPEAIVLEGKYWKRQLDAVTAEYKKWRIYYKNKISGSSMIDSDGSIFDLEGMDFSKPYSGLQMSLDDGEFPEFMDFTDVLFSSLVSPPQPFAFPNPREIARGTGNSDFIQPGLIQLQPNLEDIMDIVEPLQEMLAGRGLPTVPEEDFLPEVGQTPELPPPSTTASPDQHLHQQQPSPVSALQYTARVTANPFLEAVPSPTHNTNNSSTNNSTSGHIAITGSPLGHHPHPSPVYRSPQMPPLEQQQQPQLVSLPTQSPPSSYHQPSLLRHSTNGSLHSQSQTPIQLQPQPSTSPLQLTQQQPLTPPQLQPPLTPPHLHQQPHTPPQQLKQGPPSPQLQHHNSPRSFLRSHSQHELGTQQQQQQQQQIASHNDDAFVMPKSYPRRRSHSSGGGNNSGLVGTPTLAPQQVASTVAATSLTNLSPSINTVIATSLPHLAPAPSVGPITAAGTAIISTPVIAPVQAATTPGGSALLAQLLTSGSCPVNCSSQSASSHQLGTISASGPLNNLSNSMTVNACKNVKVSMMIPGVITGNTTASSSCSSSNSNLCSITSNSSKPGVSTSVLVAPITLSAVTPSTLKTQSFTQMSPWSPCSPKGMIVKQSPPHPEPTSPLMINVPSPPNKPFRPKSDTERVQYKEHRRVCHINAEQKRRSNLKNNFDIMHQLIPSISQSPNAKISKAALLQKGAEYIQQLKTERQQFTEEAENLRAQIETLSLEISNAQAQLPATGAPMTHASHNKLKEMFNGYVRERTLANWKFWIFSLITEPLLESYNNSVGTSSIEDLCRSSLAWLDQQCSLNVLRPLVSNSMRKLSTTTNVLADPDSLPEEIYRRVTKQEGEKFCSHR